MNTRTRFTTPVARAARQTLCTPALILALTMSTSAVAQEETFSFDWAGVSERHMRINLTGGGVTVQGHDSDEVTIVVTEAMPEDDETEMTQSGFRQLPNGGQNLVVRQDGGEIILRSGRADDYANILVRMPRNARLTVSSAMDGDIRVDDVHGELDIQAANGDVEVNGISNVAVIHAHADDLTASIAVAELPGPLVLTSWAGNVDLQMSPELRADLRWRTNYGDVLTDLDISDVQTVRERTDSEDGTRIEGFTLGRLNGGGPEISVTTFSGDIVMRGSD